MTSLKELRTRRRGREGMTPAAARAMDAVMAAYDRRDWEGGTALVLFGSRARGDARPDSDLDVAVVVDPDECDRDGLGCWLADLSDAVRRTTGVPVHLMGFSTLEMEWPAEHANPLLVENVLRDGRVMCGSLAPAPCLAP